MFLGDLLHWHRLVSSPCDVCRTMPSGWDAGLLLGTLVCDGAATHHSRTLFSRCVSLWVFSAGARSEGPP